MAARLPATPAGGSPAPSDPSAKLPSPTIYFNSASETSQIACHRVYSVLSRWRQKIAESLLNEVHLPGLAAKPFDVLSQDVAQQGHRDAAMWSKVLPFVLLIWALTGAFYPAVDLCAGEKERGTLETLLSSPAERSEIVWGKLFTIMIFSMATAILNLLSMGLTGAFIIEQLNRLPSLAETGRLSAPPAIAAVWLLVALVPIAALFSALCLALAAFARSTKEGQYYLMPLVLITMPLMILPMAPGVELSLGNSLIPITGVVLLLRTMLEGNSMQALLYAPPVAAVTLVCCLLAIRWAIDQFNKESVLFRESDRLDLHLWVTHLVRDRGPTPTVGEAICCFVLILFIQFFMNLALPPLPPAGSAAFWDLAARIVVSLVVMIALPALLMTLLFTKERRKTLLLDQRPPWLSVPVALLLALALHPVVHSIQYVVRTLYPVSDAVAHHAKFISDVLAEAPSPWLAIALIAVLPALCEEIAFRGFILSGLRHIGHKWWAIVLSAAFFGVAHGLLQQSIMAVMLGVILGFLAVQTGSLVPCLAFHMMHNALILGSAWLDFGLDTYRRFPQLELFVQPLRNGQEGFVYGWPVLLAGAVLAAYLLGWLQQRPYPKTAEEDLQEALGHQAVVPLAEDL
ncbi:MAG: hypothetical protein A2W31_07285 [Planctomycetes bacterium RBG_16_64_10]|nr:MAG: hypothetical protein A2W31_07285 [Planctomycetes bacterium RBG_16_64_10]